MSTVLVTGGAGFIGANLCRQLQHSFRRVIVLDDFSTGHAENLAGTNGDVVDVVEGSILDSDLVKRLVWEAQAVVHLAARPSVARSVEDPIRTHRINVDGTLNILEACRAKTTHPHLVFASSSSVYGSNPELPKHEDLATRPRSPYAVSKLAGEAYVLAYQDSFSLPTTAFRFFNVFGPLQRAGHAYAAVIPAFVDAALRGHPLLIQGDGEQTRDFTYVDTVAEVISDALVRSVIHPRPINLAFGTRTSIKEVARIVVEIVGSTVQTQFTPPRVGDVRDSQAANEQLTRLFPAVNPPTLEVGLSRTVEWMRADSATL